MRLFGVTDVPYRRYFTLTIQDQHSVLCHVHGFLPYLYVPASEGFLPEHVSIFHDALAVKFTNIRLNRRNQLALHRWRK